MTTASPAPSRRSWTARYGGRSEIFAGYGLVAIPLLLFLVLNIGAILLALFMSFFDWGVRSGAGEFIGAQNYQAALADPVFQKAIYNVVTYTAWVVPLQMGLGLLLAVIVNSGIKGQTFFRAAFFAPLGGLTCLGGIALTGTAR